MVSLEVTGKSSSKNKKVYTNNTDSVLPEDQTDKVRVVAQPCTPLQLDSQGLLQEQFDQ